MDTAVCYYYLLQPTAISNKKKTIFLFSYLLFNKFISVWRNASVSKYRTFKPKEVADFHVNKPGDAA